MSFNWPRRNHSATRQWIATEVADSHQICSSRAQGWADSQIAGPAKVASRLKLPHRAGRVSPSAWKVPDAVKIRPVARKLIEAMRRNMAPTSITAGSWAKAAIMTCGQIWQTPVRTSMRPDDSTAASRTVRRTRSARPAPKFWPATGATAKDTAMAGRKIDCMTRAPTP